MQHFEKITSFCSEAHFSLQNGDTVSCIYRKKRVKHESSWGPPFATAFAVFIPSSPVNFTGLPILAFPLSFCGITPHKCIPVPTPVGSSSAWVSWRFCGPWHLHLCDVFFPTPNGWSFPHQPILQFSNTNCSIQLWHKLMQTSQVKAWPHETATAPTLDSSFKSQGPPVLLTNWLYIQEFPGPLPLLWQFARVMHRTQENALFMFTSLL